MENIPITKETTLNELLDHIKKSLNTDHAQFSLMFEGETRKGFISTTFKLGYALTEDKLIPISGELNSIDNTPAIVDRFPFPMPEAKPKEDRIDLSVLKNLTERLTFSGLIRKAEYGENWEALFIGDSEEPLANILEDKIDRKIVTVRFWISEEPKEKERLLEDLILNLSGSLDATYQDSYSDYTGYLWTDEEIKVGNHDLLKDLSVHIGKYLYLEIDVHN